MASWNLPLLAIIDPDAVTRARLLRAMAHTRFAVIQAPGGLEALARVFEARPSACLVAADAPGIGAYDLVTVLSVVTRIPIAAFLREPDAQRATALLDAGADQVVTLGIGIPELVARLHALLRVRDRRMVSGSESSLRTGDLVINRASRSVTQGGVPVALTSTEYRLLDALASRIGDVASHDYLLRAVWGDDYVGDTHRLRVYVGYLRRKLGDHPSRGAYIVGERGCGYRLVRLPHADAR